MKQRIKDFISFVRNIVLLKRSSSYLVLFQNTIAVCIWIVFISIIGSVGIEMIQAKNHWLMLLENILIGVSCSALIVIITAYLQYKSEQSKAFERYRSALYEFLSALNFELEIPSTSYEERLNSINRIKPKYRLYSDLSLSLHWYSPQKDKEYDSLFRKMVPFEVAAGDFCFNKDSISKISISYRSFNEVVEMAINFIGRKSFKSQIFEYLLIDASASEPEGDTTP